MEKMVYFVRHGETDSNASGIMNGEHAKLTEKGREEAKIVAERVEKIGVDALLSSPFERTVDTAEAIAERLHLPIEKNTLFTEWRRPSAMLGQSWKDPKMQTLDDEILAGYVADSNFRHSDEETFPELKKRSEEALGFLKAHPAQQICVVTHGIFLKLVLGSVVLRTRFDAAAFQNLYRGVSMHNTGITVIRLRENQQWQLKTWNDSAHLG